MYYVKLAIAYDISMANQNFIFNNISISSENENHHPFVIQFHHTFVHKGVS